MRQRDQSGAGLTVDAAFSRDPRANVLGNAGADPDFSLNESVSRFIFSLSWRIGHDSLRS